MWKATASRVEPPEENEVVYAIPQRGEEGDECCIRGETTTVPAVEEVCVDA